KAPIVILLFYYLANRYLNKGRQGVSSRFSAVAATVTIVGVSLGYYATYGYQGAEAIRETLSRIFVAPLVGVQSYLFVFPNVLAFHYGAGIGLIQRLLGVRDLLDPPVAVAAIVSGPDVCFNTMWTADMWAAWGWPGVFVGALIVGALVVWLDRWCLS